MPALRGVAGEVGGLPSGRRRFAASPLAGLTAMLHLLAEPAHRPQLAGGPGTSGLGCARSWPSGSGRRRSAGVPHEPTSWSPPVPGRPSPRSWTMWTGSTVKPM
ncbi:DUF5937 family protein [Streptomyces sp. NPDC006290]|uniref:DUF5937 family protein n=1 Tax=Streptomyces sp. NPDC006290 TaxID=3156745 RepID=UPI0033A0793E